LRPATVALRWSVGEGVGRGRTVGAVRARAASPDTPHGRRHGPSLPVPPGGGRPAPHGAASLRHQGRARASPGPKAPAPPPRRSGRRRSMSSWRAPGSAQGRRPGLDGLGREPSEVAAGEVHKRCSASRVWLPGQPAVPHREGERGRVRGVPGGMWTLPPPACPHCPICRGRAVRSLGMTNLLACSRRLAPL
jgi:hypothetical protein